MLFWSFRSQSAESGKCTHVQARGRGLETQEPRFLGILPDSWNRAGGPESHRDRPRLRPQGTIAKLHRALQALKRKALAGHVLSV